MTPRACSWRRPARARAIALGSPDARRSWLLHAAFAIASLLVLLAAVAPVFAASRADSSRFARKVIVGPQGVTVEQSGENVADSAGVAAGDSDIDVDVRLFGHRGGIVIDGDGSGIVRMFADAEVPANEHVDGDVIVIMGSIRIAGEVSGNVVAVGGSVELLPGARVEGDAVAVGGGLRHDEGAIVNGESVSVGIFPLSFGAPALSALLLTVCSGWLFTMILGGLFAWLFPARLVQVARVASLRTGASFGMGLISIPLVAIAAFLLLVTVIGIPIALVLPIAYVLMVWCGQIAATYVLGAKILRRRLGEGGLLAPIVAGTLFIALFFLAAVLASQPDGFARTIALFLWVLGGFLVFALSSIGSGAMLLSRFGSEPREPNQAASAVASAPPLPAST